MFMKNNPGIASISVSSQAWPEVERNRPIVAFVLSLLLMFSGCAHTGRGYVTNINNAPDDKGIALFSTCARETRSVVSTTLWLVNGESRKKYDQVLINLDYPFPSDFNGEHCNLRTLSLPAGTYYFVPHSGNAYFNVTKAPIYRFSVKNGQIAYLGELYLISEGRNFRLLFSTNHSEKDLDLFLSKNPGISRGNVVSRYMELDSQPENFAIRGLIFGLP
ncbi:hypothetical protein [Trinickia symbiotica]|uniref:hypothetical protein n=2 Tax=Trinickia symbiotica TaxID=863227 RepID=UPI00131CFDB9|nr:hypothetical protein [Trinickia symbiotica]